MTFRLFGVSHHSRYQELVTPRRIAIQSVGICMDNKLRPCLPILLFTFFPKESEMVAAVISLTGYILTTVVYVRIYKVVKYHQNQIYSQNQLQNAQTREANKQRKSAYNSLFVCSFSSLLFSFFPCTILYMTNTTEISFFVSQFASEFLICLNSSLNPLAHWWRYREIRQIVKSTIKKILRLDENMT